MDGGKRAYNKNLPSVRRIMQEMKEMRADTSVDYVAFPTEEDIFEWHFILRGPADTEFEGGLYRGRIVLPAEYPFKPPSFYFYTPNGRFELNAKICLSISNYHPEHWQPSWSTLVAIIGFFPSKGEGAVGALDWSTDVRRKLAEESVNWRGSFDETNSSIFERLQKAKEPLREKERNEAAESSRSPAPSTSESDASSASTRAAVSTSPATTSTAPVARVSAPDTAPALDGSGDARSSAARPSPPMSSAPAASSAAATSSLGGGAPARSGASASAAAVSATPPRREPDDAARAVAPAASEAQTSLRRRGAADAAADAPATATRRAPASEPPQTDFLSYVAVALFVAIMWLLALKLKRSFAPRA